jgi:hypothetical protein
MSDESAFWVIVVAGLITFYFAISLLGLLVGSGSSVRLLENQGFTHIEQVDRHIFAVGLRGCAEQDSVRYDFVATNPLGRRVHINVCDGFLKGATVRG